MKTWRYAHNLTVSELIDFLEENLDHNAPTKIEMLKYSYALDSAKLEAKRDYFENTCMTKDGKEKAYQSIKRLQRKLEKLHKQIEVNK